MIGALDLAGDAGYLASAGWRVYDEARRCCSYLRPMGNVVYVTPSLNIPEDDLWPAVETILELVVQD